MDLRLRTLLLSFAIALPIGWALGNLQTTKHQPATVPQPQSGSTRQAGRISSSLDCARLLSEYEEAETREEESGADELVNLLGEWTEAELHTALDESLRNPACINRLGSHCNLPWKLFNAWMKKDPDAASAWIDTLRSAQLRDGFVREAIQQWPKDRLMEGVDFLLANHWKPGAFYTGALIRRSFESEAAKSPAGFQNLLDRFHQAKSEPLLESINLPPEFDFRSLVRSESFQAQSADSFQTVILADWRIKQPERFLTWMKESGEWKHFNEFLPSDGNPAAAARFWEQADLGTRESIASHITWKELGDEGVARFSRLIMDEVSRDAWLTECLQASFRNRELDSATILELIPSPTRRGELLRSLFPTTDFSPASPVGFNDPPNIGLLRELIGALGIPLPPPITPDPEDDPFANP